VTLAALLVDALEFSLLALYLVIAASEMRR